MAVAGLGLLAACERPVGPTQPSPGDPVVQIVTSPPSVTLDPYQTQQFLAYGRTQAGDSVAVVVRWSASGGTITSGGLYAADTVDGTYQVTAAPQVAATAPAAATTTNTTASGSSTVKNRGPLTKVILTPVTASVLAGGTLQYAAYGRRKNGDSTSVNVVYAASGGTITAAGLYTAGQTAGPYHVAATQSSGGTLTDTAAVTITNTPVASVTVSPTTASLQAGATRQFTAVIKDSAGNTLTGRAVTWASSTAAVAGVNGSGLVTGVAAGSATITATSEGQNGSSVITVTQVPVASVAVSPASASIQVGQTAQLIATPTDANGNPLSGRTMTWSSSNTTVATVSSSGLVTGKVAGSATITATSEGQSGTAAVSVTAPSCMTSAGAWQNVAIPSQAGAFEVQFDATAATASTNAAVGLSNGPAADWTNLAAIVRFDSSGTIDARNGDLYAATAMIPYTAGTAYHFRLDVNLASHAYDIYVTPAGAAEQLLGKAFAFRTEQATVSVLNNLGLDANVGGATACNVGVSPWTPPPPAPVASVTVSPTAASVSVGATVQLTATLKDASGNVLTGRSLTWASSTLGMATVSTGGVVTGVAVGAATITATSEGHTGSSAVTVTLVSDPTPLYTLGNGTNYYVAPSGSDGNPCTAAAPCYTMARVSQLMSPGDNAHFASGNYTWTYSGNKVTVSGTASAPISYVSDTKWGAKVYGSGCDPIWNSGAYVQIINFDVTGNCSDGIGVNGNYDKVIGNRVHDLPGTGGYAGIHADCCDYNIVGIQIIGNVVDNIAMGTGSNLIHGIYAAGPSSVIMNNIVTRVSAACITHYHGSTRSIVSNNVVANCKYGIQIAADGAITSDDYTTVDNNIAVNNGRGIYEYPTAGPHNVYNNNIVYNNSTANFDLCCGGTQSGTLTLTAAQFSALFVNYTGDMSGDYHLRSGAVAIDAGSTRCAAGVTGCVPLLDFDGISRPAGGAYDSGAYEWH
ncbi:MAG TPA: Ig-like domain-containing protein [Gemmatimonadales bacterium]|nr:Ig-like domain-containing protein [Gemmatimonadales bacterium]